MIENIQNEIHDLVDIAHKEGADIGESIGYSNGYCDGLIDAWEYAKEIYHMPAETLIAIFGSVSGWVNYDVADAMKKIKKHKERKHEERLQRERC